MLHFVGCYLVGLGKLEMQLPIFVLADGAREVWILLLDERPSFGDKVGRHRTLQLEGQADVHSTAYLLPEAKWPELSHGSPAFGKYLQ